LEHALQPSWSKVHTYHDDLIQSYAGLTSLDTLPQHLRIHLNIELGLDPQDNISKQEHLNAWTVRNYPIGLAVVDGFVCSLRVNSVDVIRYGDVIESCYLPTSISQRWGTFMYFQGREDKKDAIANMLHLTTTIRQLREQIPATQYLAFRANMTLSQPQKIYANAVELIQSMRWSTQLDAHAHHKGFNLMVELLEQIDYQVGDSEYIYDKRLESLADIESHFAIHITQQFIRTRFECAVDLLLYAVRINNVHWSEKMLVAIQMLGLLYQMHRDRSQVMTMLYDHYKSTHRFGESYFELINYTPNSIHLSNALHVALFVGIKTTSYMWTILDDDMIKSIEFAQWLLSHEQFETLKWYCSIMVRSNPHLNHFIAMCHLLNSHDVYRAKDYFVNCALAMAHDDPTHRTSALTKQIMQYVLPAHTSVDATLNEPMFHYYNHLRSGRVSQHPDLVIELVQLALGEELQDSNLQEELDSCKSVLFHLSLQLQRYDDAYVALISNNDPEKKKSDLRRFVMHVCDKKSVHYLIDLPFLNMDQQVCDILNELCRCTDAQKHASKYYDALIGWHAARNDYANVAKSAWECTQRLKRSEASMHDPVNDWVQSAHKRINYYLIAIHALKQQCDDGQTNSSSIMTTVNAQAKKRVRYSETADKQQENNMVTLQHIQGEYLYTKGAIQLSQDKRHVQSFINNPSDLCILLSEHCLFESAFNIAVHYSLDMDVLFTGMTSECMSNSSSVSDAVFDEFLMNYGDDDTMEMTEEVVTRKQLLWKTLERYINQYDVSGRYACLCAGVVLERGGVIPNWLVSYCTKRNVDGLIRTFVKYGMLGEGVDVWEKMNKSGVSPTLVDSMYALLLAESKSKNDGIRERAIGYCKALKQK